MLEYSLVLIFVVAGVLGSAYLALTWIGAL